MSAAVAVKLLAVLVVAGLGYLAARMRWLTTGTPGSDAARVLSNVAFYVFVPALLFRTTARLDLQAMPWRTLAAYFVPVLAVMLAVYAWQRWRRPAAPAAPSVRAISVAFGNSVQIGIPFAAAVFGEAGLAIHIPLVSLHALVLLTAVTVLVELDLARAAGRGRSGASLARTLGTTLRNTLVHPVVLPVVAGLAWHLAGRPLPPAIDEILGTLASAAVPLCLVLIGVSLAQYGVRGHLRGATAVTLGKLLLLPCAVLLTAHWGFGLAGLALAVLVMMAALPVGANALLFAQRYATLEGEATAATVASTLAFVGTAALWLAVLALLD
ncbi:MAG TPA: AEC family transporter [Burkholderiaceae bacterium]|nr:AEC family transporter [Burkholderiaceae bacterium]